MIPCTDLDVGVAVEPVEEWEAKEAEEEFLDLYLVLVGLPGERQLELSHLLVEELVEAGQARGEEVVRENPELICFCLFV